MQTPSPQPARSVHLTRLYEQWNMLTEDQQASWLSKPHNVKVVINAVIPRCTIEAKAHGIFATLNHLGEVQAMCDNHRPRKFTFQHPEKFHHDIQRLFGLRCCDGECGGAHTSRANGHAETGVGLQLRREVCVPTKSIQCFCDN